MKKLVIIPTYNEKENIENIISAVFALEDDFHILVVDDSSPDGTADLVKELQKNYPHYLHLSVRKVKDGLGKAYIHGFKWAIENKYDYIFEMDADFSHNPNDLPKLYEACLKADMAIGSRYSKGVNVVNWPMGRVLMSYYASSYVRFITGMDIRDTTSGFKCYTRKVLEKIHEKFLLTLLPAMDWDNCEAFRENPKIKNKQNKSSLKTVPYLTDFRFNEMK